MHGLCSPVNGPHYEVAAGNFLEAKKLLKSMDAFSNNGFLSEQIWDTEDIPEKELFFGEHSGSAMPLTWAHAEYVKLCASIGGQKVFDMPPQTQERYVKEKTKPTFQVWRFNHKLQKISSEKTLRIQTDVQATVQWTCDDWATENSIENEGCWYWNFYCRYQNKKEGCKKNRIYFLLE